MEKMSFLKKEQNSVEIVFEEKFSHYIPKEFLDDPLSYFEENGKNIKKGEIKYNQNGEIREDPTAVKDLPVWKDHEENQIYSVGKK